MVPPTQRSSGMAVLVVLVNHFLAVHACPSHRFERVQSKAAACAPSAQKAHGAPFVRAVLHDNEWHGKRARPCRRRPLLARRTPLRSLTAARVFDLSGPHARVIAPHPRGTSRADRGCERRWPPAAPEQQHVRALLTSRER